MMQDSTESSALVLISLLLITCATVNGGGLPENCYLNQVAPYPRSPHLFYWCLPSGPTLVRCVDSMIFDPAARKCVQPLKKKGTMRRSSSARKVNKASVTLPLAAAEYSPICPVARFGREEATVMLPSVESCTRFYVCSNGTPLRFDCPAGLWFDSKEGVCDWAWRVKNCPQSDVQDTTDTRSSSKGGARGRGKGKRKFKQPLRLQNTAYKISL